MSRKLVYEDAEGENVVLPNVSMVEHQDGFFKVEYTPTFGSKKTTMIDEDRVIRYDV